MNEPRLDPGDIFLTRGGSFISRGIRWASRSIGEERTKVNHVGIIVKGGDIHTAKVSEATQGEVMFRNLGPSYPKDEVAVFRPLNLTSEQVAMIVGEEMTHTGEKYGYAKIVLHLADKALNGAYFFRRLAFMDRRPICSYRVTHSFGIAGLDFGVSEKQAQPDDIWDFCMKETDKYELVRPLSRVPSLRLV